MEENAFHVLTSGPSHGRCLLLMIVAINTGCKDVIIKLLLSVVFWLSDWGMEMGFLP